ncbi:MAG: acetyltransferase [Burkholderiales bacterium]
MPIFYDVFNGDADGICALHQLRLAEPRASVLVTGVKRDIALLDRVAAQAGDLVTVLDISLARNATALQTLLARGASCRYFDHHVTGAVPVHPQLETFIDTAPDVCTSLLVDRYLSGRHRGWAVVAAFGDNLAASAQQVAASLALNDLQLAQLCELGECINYNAYGDSVDDLNYPPAELYQTVARYADPFQFISGEPVFEILRAARADDLFLASEIAPALSTASGAVYVLPDRAWSRRVSGTFGNQLAAASPARAHAVLTARGDGFTVSVRSPLDNPRHADELCRQFAGGGRQGAAGIDLLPGADYERFVAALIQTFG